MTRLVNVFLRGAADGLSLLSPVGDPAYRRARPTLALDDETTTDIGIDGFRLHRSAVRLAEFAKAGNVAFVPAAGFPGQSRSHFEAQALLESATGPDGSRVADGAGWLGRLLAERAGSTVQCFRGVAVGSVSLPPSMRGSADALSAPALAALRLGAIRPAKNLRGTYKVVDSPLSPDIGSLTAAWSVSAGSPAASVAGTAAAQAVLDRLDGAPIELGDTAAFGEGEEASLFASASALLDADLGTEVVQVDLGGWDTHNEQGVTDGKFAELVGALDTGLGALLDRHSGRDGGLVVTVMTEFGRRVQENASGGTDHGRGGLALVLGDGVAGGLRGTWPGLDDLDDGDVRAVNDLRVLQAEVAAEVFGITTPTPDGTAPLGLFAA